MANKPAVTVIWPKMANVLQEMTVSQLPEQLKKQLNKGRFTRDERPLAHVLTDLFSAQSFVDADLPVASLREVRQPSLCADPCYLHADRDRLLLFPIDDLTLNEASRLINTIQPILATFAAELVMIDANHWSILLEKIPDISLTAMPSLTAKSVMAALPTGAEKADWLRLWNEIQMLLFEHPVNQQRQLAGKLPVNSVWFWGLADWQPKTDRWQRVYGDDRLLMLLAKACGSPIYPPISEWQKNTINNKQLMLLPALDLDGDWQHETQQIVTDYIRPLWKMLRSFQVNELRLILPEHGQYRWTRWDAWKPW